MKKLIICDWNRTLFNPEENKLYSGSLPFLKTLKDSVLILVSTNEIDSGLQFVNSNIKEYFTHIFFNVEKNIKLFSEIKEKFSDCDPWVIGDRINSEIKIGNQTGYKTIWLRQGKFSNDLPNNKINTPNFIVENLSDATIILLS